MCHYIRHPFLNYWLLRPSQLHTLNVFDAQTVVDVLIKYIIYNERHKKERKQIIHLDDLELLLNSDKTEVIIFGLEPFREKLSSYKLTLNGISLASSATVRNLIFFYQNLSFDSHESSD